MKNEKILTVIKGQEFKLSLKDKIEINDIFYDQYLEAAAMLENIMANEESDKQPDWKKAETENNIIAFCGERGEGKSSAMFTFINAVVNEKEQKESTIFAQCENVKNTVFSEPIVIDPSAFDNVHNVLDIIIASIYQKFSDKYDVSPERFDNYRREQLLNEFQKVYKDISLLNDPAKMLEEEYDYEGSIEKISKMGESLRLRRDLSNLVKLYLDYMMPEDSRNQYTSKKLLIAIDDLDMCNANAYKMAEQIRKYLIIPDIVIVMALKVEQLQLCVQEENFKNYSNVLKNQEKIAGAILDVEDMAERYIAKLIPKSRRIYLPNVRYIENAKISYQKKNGEIIYEDKMTNSLNASLMDLIYMKTGMRFLLNEEKLNWLQPDNLRDTVNLIILLGDMKVPENDSEYLENIEKFTEYFEKEWIPQNCELVNYKEVQNLIRVPYLQLNSEAAYMLNKNYQNAEKRYPLLPANFLMDRANCFFWVMNWFWGYKNSMYDKKDDKFAYMFKILYEDELVRLALNESLTKKNMLSLEARICPKNTSAKLIKNLKKYKRIVKSEPVNDGYDKLIYVLHFPKLFDRPFKDGVPRNNNVRKMAARQARSIVAMLDKNGEINQHIKGIDACSSEIACRPEVFGQIYRYLTAKRVKVENASRFHNCEDVQNLQMTYHVGEDFFDITDGLRAIDEVLLFCNYRRGSRLGHALALGISPEKYYAMKGYKVVLSKQILLDDIVWLYCRSGELGCSLDEKLKTNLIEKYTSLYKEIYENNVGNGPCPSIHEYYQSWKLRGDNPQCYRLEEKEFNAALETTELVYFDRFRFNPRVDNNLRRNKRYRDLYYYYHFNKKVREKGNEVTEFKVTKEYIKLVRIMQDKMIAELACKGIGIETNPSSNYLIGTIKKYEEHPILRFNSRKLKATNTGENLCVSINTDDQGVFDTLLENEYALMTLALKKATDDDMNALYDIEDIYEWSDYVRRMGIDQVFS